MVGAQAVATPGDRAAGTGRRRCPDGV